MIDYARKSYHRQIDLHRLIEAVAVGLVLLLAMIDLGGVL